MAMIESISPSVGMSPYMEFLDVANRAAREADNTQRAQLRAVARDHTEIARATARIKSVMGWD